jgi:chemotaxis protein MotB
MRALDSSLVDEGPNPYIALADLCVSLILILAFFVAALNVLGRTGWEKVRYREKQRDFAAAVAVGLPLSVRPHEVTWRNDPPGAQRWVFSRAQLFKPGTAVLTASGVGALEVFSRLLNKHRREWRRIRVEGHTLPPSPDGLDDWNLSSARAAAVAQVIHSRGHIEGYYLAVSGRAGQAPLDRARKQDLSNERVEIVLEYARQAARDR